MDSKLNKFAEISPVLELIYVMLTNMTKYLNVYAKDIDAGKLMQYQEAKEALSAALKKFDAFYGLESNTDVGDGEPTVAAPEENIPVAAASIVPAVSEKPIKFASGEDEDSLKKAKEAVTELKALFADMKKEEVGQLETPVAAIPAETPVAPAPILPPIAEEEKIVSVEAIPSGDVEAAAPVVAAQTVVPQVPTPMNTDEVTAPKTEDKEIDGILAELRKLQKKGGEL